MHAITVPQECKDIKLLREQGVYLSPQAAHILNGSDQFDELGRMIFLDRYSIKSKREHIDKGDLVIVITLEDRKYPRKDLGIVSTIDAQENVTLHMITGKYASEEEHFTFTTALRKCSKPVESIDDAYKRVARAAASIEPVEQQEQLFQTFYEQLQSKKIQPAGRIMTGANSDSATYTGRLTLYNCYVLPCPKDSRQGILQTLAHMVETMSRGGGVGISLASLRPRYSYVQGVHGQSSGSVSWGGLYSYVTGLIEQGGSRRGALMLMQADWHPDILEFIQSKTKMGQIENANISVMMSDRFMKALKEDGDWCFEFPDYERQEYKELYEKEWTGDLFAWKQKGYPVKIYGTIKAKELWDKLLNSAWLSAEPGIVFMERYNKMSNSWYFNPIICTNPCGEQGLPGWGVCNLGHLYLGSFAKEVGKDATGPLYEMDWNALSESSRVLTRFLDNIIDHTPYFFEENRTNQKSERRVGGGTLGLGELLIKLRIKYGSEQSLQVIDNIYKTIAINMYLESVRLAKEKGPFPQCDAEKLLQSGFMQSLPEELRETIRQFGIRNVTLTTQAPTGTVGSMLGTSTGIEPYYAFEYYRQSRLGFHKVLIPLAEQYKTPDGNLPDFFVSAMNLGPVEHIKVQAAVQRWTDSSISKTANAPPHFTLEETKSLYELAYDLGCKGVTIYRDGCRNEQVLSTSQDTEKKNLASAQGHISADLIPPSEQQPRSTIVGADIGNTCPNCHEGTMLKIGGCTECSKHCGFTGACDVK